MCPGSHDLLRERAGLYEAGTDHDKALNDYTVGLPPSPSPPPLPLPLSLQAVLSLKPNDPVSLERVGDHCLREKSVISSKER